MGDVLRITEESGSGVNHTSLLRKANLSHTSLRRAVSKLASAGLISEQLDADQRIYSITGKGRAYLDRYKQFAQVSDAFGLQL